MKKKAADIALVAVFSAFLALFLVWELVRPKGDVSEAERRKLAQAPELSVSTILNGKFMDGFEDFAADQFPLRESWRTLKASAIFKLFNLSDKDGLYVYDGSICKFTKTDEASFVSAAAKLMKLKADYLGDIPCFFALIPDKGHYAEGYPGYDYELIRSVMGDMDGIEYVDLSDALTLDSYYKTDLHWKQTELQGVVDTLEAKLGFTADISGLTPADLGSFAGAYLGQLSVPMEEDELIILTGGSMDEAGITAEYLDETTLEYAPLPIYSASALEGVDGYDAFLGGAKPIVRLVNPSLSNGRNLVVFRDSFTSSLAPLLSLGFDTVTLVDLRYIASPALPDYVDFSSMTDALFIYGPELLNSSATLLVK